MKQAAWLSSTDPDPMLNYLRGRCAERKARLFAAACCRRVWHLLPEGAYRRAVEVAEAFTEGRATREELALAHENATALDDALSEQDDEGTPDAEIDAAAATLNASDPADVFRAAAAASNNVALALAWDRRPEDGCDPDAAAAELADLLREIVGNPFRPTVVEPDWLAWNDGLVRNLAAAIEAEQAFDRLPILADALEDAGCTDAALLEHLRSPGPHVRGCWALDLVLGRAK